MKLTCFLGYDEDLRPCIIMSRLLDN